MSDLTDALVQKIFGGGEEAGEPAGAPQVEGEGPPNLREGDGAARCGLCVHWDAGTSMCQLYGVQTEEVEVCDSFEAAPGGEGLPS